MKARSLLAAVITTAALLTALGASSADIRTGAVPPAITLEGADGGRLDGAPWSSRDMKGRVTVLFYVDPDCKDRNEHVAEAIRTRHYPGDRFGSVAVVNLAATWKPKWIIGAILRRKQKKYPRTVYVFDRRKVLVREWGLADDDYEIAAFDPAGRVLFRKAGRFSDGDVKSLLHVLDDAVARAAGARPAAAPPAKAASPLKTPGP